VRLIAALEMLFVHNNGEPPTPEEVARLQEEVLATCCRKKKPFSQRANTVMQRTVESRWCSGRGCLPPLILAAVMPPSSTEFVCEMLGLGLVGSGAAE